MTNHRSTDMILLIDDREEALLCLMQSSQIPQQYVKQRLPLGDIAISELETATPRVLIERKTVIDFLQSARDNRLHDQLNRLEMDQTPQKWLLIEGCVDTGIKVFATYARQTEAITRALYLSLLSRVIIGYDNIHVIQLPDLSDTHQFIIKRFTHTNSNQINQIMRIPWQPSKKRMHNIGYMSFLLSFPGMGLKRCQTLVQKFNNLRCLTNATEEQITEVIGKKIANTICLSFDDTPLF